MQTTYHRIRVLDDVLEVRVLHSSDINSIPGETTELTPTSVVVEEEHRLTVDVIISPEWRNDRTETGIVFERRGDGRPRIVVERPFLSGSFTKTVQGFEGSFTVCGRTGAHLDGIASLGLALLCEQQGDLLLHASAVAQGDRAWLFLGEGGAGKTTIATELNEDRTTLCVDKSLVSSRPDGILRVHATPFGDGLDAPQRTGHAEIVGLFFIEQAEEHAVEKLSRWEATRRLLGNVIAPSRDQLSVQRTMDAVGKIADLDAAFNLRFRKDPGFWPLVEGALQKR